MSDDTRPAAPPAGYTEDELAGSIAVVGMACRFPGAPDVEAFWTNLERGVESITFFEREELLAAGADPAEVDHPAYVPAKPRLDDVDLFDAPFFDTTPRDAEILDPQQRLFLEVAWEALERSGYAVEDYPGWIGLFAGVSFPAYWVEHLARRPDVVASIGAFQVFLANDRDYFATRTSYKLDLKGPSVNVQSACSTSLVAVHLACQSLLDHQSDVALAGGARVHLPRTAGYLYQEGGIVSPDGHCRAFDADAGGSIFGDGVGVVVLKRLADALADGDTVRAVIRGSAMNNDGSGKVGYTAPSVDGQAEVIALAQGIAGVDPGTITYVEAHGSGTPLGDPIEIAALTDAFRRGTDAVGTCAVGSVKSNFGHLEAAAGVAGLIKTILALEHGKIPPTLHYEKPNPRIDWAGSPFYVADRLAEWRPEGAPRRAGVSSFGIGGTNVHVVLEEAPAPPAEPRPSREVQLLALSARTPEALEAATDRLADWLDGAEDDALPDAAYTLLAGRRRFEHRRALLCRSRAEAVEALRARDPRRLLEGTGGGAVQPVFLFAGLGDHYVGMGRGLYRDEPVFRDEIDRAAEALVDLLGTDVRDVLYAETGGGSPPAGGLDLRSMLGRGAAPATGPAAELERLPLLHPVLFALEHALARLWTSFGVEPAALVGYSLGEYVAATVAGVLPFEDALAAVAERARRVDELEPGAMLAVPLAADEARAEIAPPLAIAALNGPRLTVVAGPIEAVVELEARLAERGLASRRLPATHAFHTDLLGDAAPHVAAVLDAAELSPPTIPIVSNTTGTWLSDEEATDPAYWARHLVRPVDFAGGLGTLFEAGHRTFVEIGPGQGLGSLVHQQADRLGDEAGELVVVPSLPAGFDRRPDGERLLASLAELWLAGVRVGEGFWAGEERRRLPLPTYPFERRRYWIEAPPRPTAAQIAAFQAMQAGQAAQAGATAVAEASRESSAAGASGGDGPTALPAPAPAAAGGHDRPRLPTPYVEPSTPLEERLAAVWGQVLGIGRIGVHDDFFALGGNSLIVPQVLLKVREAVGVELAVPALLADPTVGGLARAVEAARAGDGEAAAAAAAGRPTREELEAAAELPADVRSADDRAAIALDAEPREIFLTGGTGFFGAFLLAELLERTDARIHCLVRADDEAAGAARLAEALRTYRLDPGPDAGERIVPVPGDLVHERFGLDEEAFARLAETADAVYHGGAWVNFTYPFSALAPANVGGTREALRLAAAGRPKPFHFVSSIAVFAPGSLGDDGLAYEDSDLPATDGLFAGYAETKWAAERMVREAERRGLPVTIHRPGVIGGDSRTGAGNPRDLVWNLLKGSIELGAAPAGIGTIDVAPADYVAAALVAASRRADSAGRAFHYPNPETTHWDQAFRAAAELGYPLELVPYGEWRRRLLAAVEAGQDNALAAFLPLLPPAPAEAAGETRDEAGAAVTPAEERPRLRARRGDDDSNTRRALAGTAIACPPLDEALLATYLRYFAEIGFLPTPASAVV